MNLQELNALATDGESQHAEFKRSTGQRTEAAKTICGMLNGLGGYVLFGVDDKGALVGQQISAQTLNALAAEIQRIEPPAFPAVETIDLGKGKAVIAVTVAGLHNGTHQYDGRAYIRRGARTERMPREEFSRRTMEQLHGSRRWENEFAPDWVEFADLDGEEIENTLSEAIRLGRLDRQYRGEDTESALRGLELVRDGRFLNAAVALYGKSARLMPHFTQCGLRLAKFRGRDRLAEFTDNRQFWGNIFALLDKAEIFLRDHVAIAGRVVPGKMRREDRPAYPPRATREALANAFCHRDYTIAGAAVSVAMFDDRLEIANPGPLPFGLTPQDLVKPHASRPWNPIIASVLYRRGIIERWGMGTLSIVNWCRQNVNPDPTWDIWPDNTVVTTFRPAKPFQQEMRRGAKAKAQDKAQVEAQDKAQVGPQGKGQDRGHEEGQDDETPLDWKILELCNHAPHSSTELRSTLGYASRVGHFKRRLSDLLANGLLSMTIPDKPTSRLQMYTLTPKGKTWLNRHEKRSERK